MVEFYLDDRRVFARTVSLGHPQKVAVDVTGGLRLVVKLTSSSCDDTVSSSFDVTGATSLTINPTPGTVTTSPVAVTPHVSTVYTLRAANDAGADSKDVSINVKPMPTAAQISYFSALPSQVAPNGQVTLTWSVARATSIKIYDGTTTVDVTAASQLVVPQLAATTRYTMTVGEPRGTAKECQTEVIQTARSAGH